LQSINFKVKHDYKAQPHCIKAFHGTEFAAKNTQGPFCMTPEAFWTNKQANHISTTYDSSIIMITQKVCK